MVIFMNPGMHLMWISEQNVLPTNSINSAEIWSVPGEKYLLNFSTAVSISKQLSSGSNSSGVLFLAV